MEAIISHGLRFPSNLRYTTLFFTNKAFPASRYLCCADSRYWILGSNENNARHKSTLCSYFLYSPDHILYQRTLKANFNKYITLSYSTEPQKQSKGDSEEPLPKKPLSSFQKLKQLAKDYWYILIPVHVTTSLGWAALFYLMIKNGVDIAGILEKCHLSDYYLNMIRNSGAGNWALTYALYKMFTPARYTVTMGGTTMCVRYLSRLGYLKASSFKKAATKVEQSQKSTTKHKSTYKTERQTEPPKT